MTTSSMTFHRAWFPIQMTSGEIIWFRMYSKVTSTVIGTDGKEYLEHITRTKWV